MARPFDVEVVAADHKVYSGQAVSLVVPGEDGYLGILAEHAPLVAGLSVGIVTVTPPNGAAFALAISGGFVRVEHDKVIILADTAELSSDIDLDRARKAKERAEERMRARVPDVDFDRAQAALLRALNRLRVVQGR